jgi:membrane-associated protein
MEVLHFLIDFVLHIDRYLQTFVQMYGFWVYVLLFLIVFAETGLVVLPFLPGDSMLFVVGAMCGLGLMDYATTVVVLFVAAVLGNQTNYTIGKIIGHKVFTWEKSRFFNRQAFDQAHAFYEKNGGMTLVVARFMPFVRTFAPFVAGVAEMSRRKFTFYDISGGALWVGSLVTAGYLFGGTPIIKDNLEKIVWATVLIPCFLVFFGAWRAQRQK